MMLPMRTRTRTPFRVMTVAAALALLVVVTPIQAWDSDSAGEPVCTTETADSAMCQGEGKVVDDSGCTDEHVKCGEWADLGECGKYIWSSFAWSYNARMGPFASHIVFLFKFNCQWPTRRTC